MSEYLMLEDYSVENKEHLKEKIVILEDLVTKIEASIEYHEHKINTYIEEQNEFEDRNITKLYKDAKKELSDLYQRLPLEKGRLTYYKNYLYHLEKEDKSDISLMLDNGKLKQFLELEIARQERDSRLILDDDIEYYLKKREKLRKKLKRMERRESHILRNYAIAAAVVTLGATSGFCYIGMPFLIGFLLGLPTGSMTALLFSLINYAVSVIEFYNKEEMENELECLNDKLIEIKEQEKMKGLAKEKTDNTSITEKEESRTVEQVIENMTDVEQLKKLRDRINREITSKSQEQEEIKGTQKIKK